MEDKTAVFGTRLRVLYGAFLIVLGIVLGIVTYKYVFPMGSIMLVLSGLILIFWKRWNCVMHCAMMKITGEEIK